MKNLIKQFIPRSVKQRIKESDYYKHKAVADLAMTSKRVDICSAQMAHMLHLSNHSPIEGKVCMELGAGWVLSHALVCYLLGAKKIIATDVMPIARPDTLSLALKSAIASIPRDLLAPFSDHARIRQRYDNLLSYGTYDFGVLEELGIQYRSPVDLAAEQIDQEIDFIYSNSVLEHVPVNDIQPLLNNLASCLAAGGTMIHCIHLEDHQDIAGDPFRFLEIPAEQFTPELQSNRGNRIRCGKWEKYFDGLPGLTSELIYRYSRLDKPLPDTIEQSIAYVDEADLRVSHIGVYTRKIA